MERETHPFGQKPILTLLKQLAIPAIIANVVNALYNIVDQIFIGQGVGYLGNAATNIAFPLVTMCLAIGLMLGIGSASKFNLELGRGNAHLARKAAGSTASTLFIVGIVLCLVMRMFLEPLLNSFGATASILEYAKTYTGITSLGIPFLLFSIGSNPLVRADGAARYSMIGIIIGALLNTILDPIFIFAFDWGIAGAAWATVISQVVSAIFLMAYFRHFKSVTFERSDFMPDIKMVATVCSLGMASFIFQAANVLVQIVTNNALKNYGSLSQYGSEIPIAVAGIVAKVNVIFLAVVIGIVQGAQPILSYNYGAKHYDRVQETIRVALKAVGLVSLICWVGFELFPAQMLSIFGSGSELYFEFGVHYMRIFFLFCVINGIQIFASTFFPSIGKAKIGAVISVTKQIGLIIPLLLILPLIWGVEGLVIAIPVADVLSFLLAGYFLKREYDQMSGEYKSVL
ncbi:MATE family efflux transporter [Streptococcus merionis]|uniref:MATE family efflux transporter n=1 Tax=Streptococcus merionis TaxID=400065 RepID=UPI0035143FCA